MMPASVAKKTSFKSSLQREKNVVHSVVSLFLPAILRLCCQKCLDTPFGKFRCHVIRPVLWSTLYIAACTKLNWNTWASSRIFPFFYWMWCKNFGAVPYQWNSLSRISAVLNDSPTRTTRSEENLLIWCRFHRRDGNGLASTIQIGFIHHYGWKWVQIFLINLAPSPVTCGYPITKHV